MRSGFPTSLRDGVTFPQHQIEMQGILGLMSRNRLQLIMLFTIDHNMQRLLLHFVNSPIGEIVSDYKRKK